MAVTINLQEKVMRLRGELRDSSLTFDRREALHDILDSASAAVEAPATNKVQKLSEAFLLLTFITLDDKLHAEETKASIIASVGALHDASCPFGEGKVFSTKLAVVIKLAWPLTVFGSVALICGYGAPLVEALTKLLT